MAKTQRKTKAPAAPVSTGIDATPERIAMSHTTIVDAQRTGQERMGKARRVRPPIDILREVGSLNEDEHAALTFYGDQCRMARKSPIRDSLNFERGNGGELSSAVVSAILAEHRIDKDLGQLRDIAHALAVDEWTLARWCIEKHGGRERYGPGGKFIAVVPICEARNMKIALMELKMAAHRIIK